MRWDEFIGQEHLAAAIEAGHTKQPDDDHIFAVTSGGAEWFEDIGLPHQEGPEGRDNVIVGVQMNHRTPSGETCGGSATLARAKQPDGSVVESERVWKVEQLEPLTITPSIQCSCGEHGHITDGRWVPA